MWFLPSVVFLVVLADYGAWSQDVSKLTTLPDDILATYLCNGLQTGVEIGRKKRSVSPIVKRQTTSIDDINDTFGPNKVERLQNSLFNFFNEDIEDYASFMMETLDKYKFYWVERTVLWKILSSRGVPNVSKVITAIQNLSKIGSLWDKLVDYEKENPKEYCDLINRAYQSTDQDTADCAFWSASHVGNAYTCEPVSLG